MHLISKYSASPSAIVQSSPPRDANQLRDELKSLGMSPVGNKAAMVKRLQKARSSSNPPMDASPETLDHPSPSPHKKTTPSKAPTPTRTSNNKKIKGFTSEDIGFLKSPITTLHLAIRCGVSLARGCGGFSNSPLRLMNTIVFFSLIVSLWIVDGPHQVYFGPIKNIVMWYGRWIVLGILSSVGLGTGAHTFLLFLGPFIARVTTAAYVCRSIAFPLFGVDSLLCPMEPFEKVSLSLLMIVNKIKWEAFAWGLGTALGELPPYLIARACIFSP